MFSSFRTFKNTAENYENPFLRYTKFSNTFFYPNKFIDNIYGIRNYAYIYVNNPIPTFHSEYKIKGYFRFMSTI